MYLKNETFTKKKSRSSKNEDSFVSCVLKIPEFLKEQDVLPF